VGIFAFEVEMIPDNFEMCSFDEATHVEIKKGYLEKILEKYGQGPNGELAPPSEGGFGCITEVGRVTMWQAKAYWREA
jgi:hypothetical protein